MARIVKSGFPRAVGRVRRKVAWSKTANLTGVTNVPASSAVLFSVLVPQVPEQTILRVRGAFFFLSDQAVAGENQFGGFGLGIVSEQAASIGISAIPHPVTDGADGLWMVHQFFASSFDFQSAVGIAPRAGQSIVIDSKAMRKIGSDQRLVFVVENVHASDGFSAWVQFRVLSRIN